MLVKFPKLLYNTCDSLITADSSLHGMKEIYRFPLRTEKTTLQQKLIFKRLKPRKRFNRHSFNPNSSGLPLLSTLLPDWPCPVEPSSREDIRRSHPEHRAFPGTSLPLLLKQIRCAFHQHSIPPSSQNTTPPISLCHLPCTCAYKRSNFTSLSPQYLVSPFRLE